MPQKKVLKPDVTLGELLVLARFGALSQSSGAIPSFQKLGIEFDASKDSIGRAMQTIAKAFGDDEPDVEMGSTGNPSTKWRNIGGAAVLAHLIIEIAQDPKTNQRRLMQTISELIDQAQSRYEIGILSRPPHEVRF